MSQKYDNQIYTQVKESFSYIDDIPVAAAIIDLELNYIVSANAMFEEVFEIKNFPVSFEMVSNYDFSSFIREIEITKANLILTNTEMVMLNSVQGNKINGDIKIKLLNKVKQNLAVMVVNTRAVNENTPNDENEKDNISVITSNYDVLKDIAEGLPILTYIYDVETTEIIYLNEYTKGFFKGNSNEEIIKKLGIHIDISKNSENVLNYEKSVSGIWFKMSEITSLFSGNRVVKIGVGIDITESKREEQKISASSITDKLTGTYNRIVGFNRLQECIDRVKEEGNIFSLCYIDINRLNFVNDNFGQTEGDRYIKTVVSTIRKIIRRSDVFSRVGGDEFIIVLADCSKLTAERIMKSINYRLEEISREEHNSYDYSISYGVIEVNDKMELNLERLVQSAENEMCRYSFEINKKL